MLARTLPEVVAVVDDATLPDSTRFVVARFAEALDPTSPIHRRAIAHCDPRAIVRDLTAAIRLHDAAGGTGHEWKLLLARLERTRQLLGFDIALRKHWPTEVQRLQVALAAAPQPQGRRGDRAAAAQWSVSAGVVLQAAVALRQALNDAKGSYRLTLAGIVARTTTTPLQSPEAKRRTEERIGLLAAMILDEGQDACTAARRVAVAAGKPPATRSAAVRQALSAGARDYEVLMAASGFRPWPDLGPAFRVHRLDRTMPELARFWPLRSLFRFTLAARFRRADTVVSVRLKARDPAHAVRAGRAAARELGAHQATRSLYHRPELLDVALVRRKGHQRAVMVHRPAWHLALKTLEPHPPTTAAGALRYGARAATAESDVARVLDSWIALEALMQGRASGSPGREICREVPDLVWNLVVRDTLVTPMQTMMRDPSTAARLVRGYILSNGAPVEERWLDVLWGNAPPTVLDALSQHANRLDPLRRWRLEEARHLLRNGKLLVRRADRHRRQAEWLLRRLREQRNMIAHQAAGDQPFTSPTRTYDTDASLPTDARVLGALGVGLLATIGEIAAVTLVPGGGSSSTQSLLSATRSRHRDLRARLLTRGTGQRALVYPPPAY